MFYLRFGAILRSHRVNINAPQNWTTFDDISALILPCVAFWCVATANEVITDMGPTNHMKIIVSLHTVPRQSVPLLSACMRLGMLSIQYRCKKSHRGYHTFCFMHPPAFSVQQPMLQSSSSLPSIGFYTLWATIEIFFLSIFLSFHFDHKESYCLSSHQSAKETLSCIHAPNSIQRSIASSNNSGSIHSLSRQGDPHETHVIPFSPPSLSFQHSNHHSSSLSYLS